jgi:putative toxin-antitoxin system antitoxin component (TIGR02293 family)
MTVEESDRVVRLTRIQALTEDVFGDAEKASRWLREKLAILDGKPPLEVVRTESGARVVEQILTCTPCRNPRNPQAEGRTAEIVGE